MSEENPTIPNMAVVKQIDPLGELPPVDHLLPDAELFPKEKQEDGCRPLKNGRHEKFCITLTGWGGDGKRIENCKAYERVYGKGGSTARSESTHLLARPDVAARVRYLEKKVQEAKRHDYLAAQQTIDELRLGVIERSKVNHKLVPMALVAARDFEKAHGLDQMAPTVTTTVEETREASGNPLDGIAASLKRVVRTTRTEQNG